MVELVQIVAWEADPEALAELVQVEAAEADPEALAELVQIEATEAVPAALAELEWDGAAEEVPAALAELEQVAAAAAIAQVLWMQKPINHHHLSNAHNLVHFQEGTKFTLDWYMSREPLLEPQCSEWSQLYQLLWLLHQHLESPTPWAKQPNSLLSAVLHPALSEPARRVSMVSGFLVVSL